MCKFLIKIVHHNTVAVVVLKSQGFEFKPENDHLLVEEVMKLGSCRESADGTFTFKHIPLHNFMGFFPHK